MFKTNPMKLKAEHEAMMAELHLAAMQSLKRKLEERR